jgi:hypothetical protein
MSLDSSKISPMLQSRFQTTQALGRTQQRRSIPGQNGSRRQCGPPTSASPRSAPST